MDKEDGILLSHKKNEIMSFVATWMDLEIIMRSEVLQEEQDISYDMTYKNYDIVKTMTRMNSFRKQICGYQEGGGLEEG